MTELPRVLGFAPARDPGVDPGRAPPAICRMMKSRTGVVEQTVRLRRGTSIDSRSAKCERAV